MTHPGNELRCRAAGTRFGRAGLLFAIAWASVAQAVGAQAIDPNVEMRPVLTVDATEKVAAAAIACSQALGYHVTVTVVDHEGVVMTQVRDPSAGPQTEASSRLKAFTAVAFGAPTSVLATRVADASGPSIKDLPGTLFDGGGVPITYGGATIAGVGVGGSPGFDLDEKCATAGAAAAGS